MTPLVGDKVIVEKGLIIDILPRKNRLARPPVSNIDMLVIIIAATMPKPDLLMVDKLIVEAKCAGMDVTLCINKCDLSSQNAQMLAQEYANTGVGVLIISAKDHIGIQELKDKLKGKTACFAGQSAAGKSSTINALYPGLGLVTGELSKRVERGKHTTRHCEIFITEDSKVIDTPGFSLIAVSEIPPCELADYYDEMRLCPGCRFTGCIHKDEPGCAVKEQLGKTINSNRYARYLEILEELQEAERNKYD